MRKKKRNKRVVLEYIIILIRTCLPYFMWYAGGLAMQQRGKWAFGGEIFIPIAVSFLVSYLEKWINK